MRIVAMIRCGIALLVSLPLGLMSARAGVFANMDVTSNGVTQTFGSTLPTASRFALGAAEARLQFGATPGCVGLA